MSGKLLLTCMKTFGFHSKIRCNFPDMSYLSETQKNKITFNSYNYNFFRYSFSLVFFNYVFLKITFPVNNVSHI